MLFELLTNLDQNLIWIVQNYGFLIYPLLFLIIFIETGLVIIPFLPGDSLLFTSGVLASQGLVNVLTIFLITALAAILGDTVNYWIGNFVGKKISNGKLVRKEHLIKTQKFYEKYGGKTIIIARFIPIIRTFAPFVAGIGKMKYSKFLLFNIIGGILWTSVMVFSGFFFGNIPIVKDNLSVCIILIVIISFIPAIVELIKGRRKV